MQGRISEYTGGQAGPVARLNGNRVLLICCAALAATILWMVHDNLIARSIYARTFTARPLPALTDISLMTLAILPAFWLPVRLRKPSDSFLLFIYVLSYLPLTVLMPRLAADTGTSLMAAATIFVGFTAIAMISSLPRPARPPSFVSPVQARLGLLLLLGLSLLLVVVEFGLPTRLPTFQTLYEDRAAFLDKSSSDILGRLARYQIFFIILVFVPLIICFSSRSYMVLFAYIFICTLLYTVTFYKILVLQPIIFLIMYAVSSRGQISSKGVLLSYAGLMVFSFLFIDYVFAADQSFAFISGIARVFMVSGLLGSLYHDEFVGNAWSSDETISHQAYAIGTLYFGDETMLATSSFWMLAFSEGLYFGILWVSALLGAALWLLNWATPAYAARVLVALGASYGYFLSGSGLTTALGTYGLAPLILLLMLLPSRDQHPDA